MADKIVAKAAGNEDTTISIIIRVYYSRTRVDLIFGGESEQAVHMVTVSVCVIYKR